ncbi:hypothetical protein [Nitrosomonas marina]|uniref:Uncharacterized protein n=1 Tax=Nitrosomonas marina TaxID=917 RepID=A0A1H8IQY0_9PROT|nr:hypothetical protein [Nitrosomonas marina]SEN71320.1 hypothetical protein SAMN05216325_13916 [Nitrosomonas marina]
MKKNVAGQSIGAQMVSASDGSAFTGSVTVYITGDNGAQTIGSVGSGACTHEGNGYHSYAPSQAETNYNHIAFTFIGAGAVPATVQVYTGFPQSGDNYTRLGAPVGASIAADLGTITDKFPVNSELHAIDAEGRVRIDDASATLVQQFMDEDSVIKTKIDSIDTRTVNALVNGRVPADTEAIDGNASAATNLKEHALRAVPVTFAAGGTTTTAVLATVGGGAPNGASNVIYKNAALVFSAPAALKDQRALIQSYDAATNTATITEVAAAVDETAVAVLV